jgi:serine/threonine protein kinase
MSILNGRYEIIETLGTGATSRVDKARDTLIGRTVALKTFLNGFGSRQLQEQFHREAQIIGQLAHPSIVSLYDVGTDSNGRPYFVMEFVEGETLERALESGPLLPEKAAAWGGDLATALGCAHQAKIIHGDVKPSNILITKEGRLKLGDFGIARYSTQASFSGNVNGTPAFLSPEQILHQIQDARSDLFSLGIVLYQMTTGVHPFDGNSVAAVCGQIISATPEPPSSHNPVLSPTFDAIVMRCLAKNPADRFATGEDLAVSLYPLARAKNPHTYPSSQERDASPLMADVRGGTASKLPRRSTGQTGRTTWHSVTSWWNRPLRGSDVWVAGVSAGILALSLMPLTRVLHGRTHLSSGPKREVASAASNIPVASPVPSPPLLNSSAETQSRIAAAASKAKNHQATNPRSPQRKDSRLSAHTVVASPQPKPAGDTSTKSATSSNLAVPSPDQQTSLDIAVVSEAEDVTVAVYADDELLFKTPLEAAHRGDTLRFKCPIATGDHLLRVTVYHGANEVVAQKENNSELRAAEGNTMEVHVSRRSRMLVKHQTSLEIVWPNRAVASPLHANTQSASTN